MISASNLPQPCRRSTFVLVRMHRCSSTVRSTCGFFVILVITAILVIGIKESANFTTGDRDPEGRRGLRVHRAWQRVPGHARLATQTGTRSFRPTPGRAAQFGWSGILRGAGVVFFAYIGFDAVSTAAQEAKNPQARHADRHPRIAGDLHRPLHPGFAAADRTSCPTRSSTCPIRSWSACA